MTESYLTALAITLVLETLVVFLLFKGQRVRMAIVCMCTTSLTHLFMFHVLVLFFDTYAMFMIVGEVFATAAEAGSYALFSKPRDIPRALIASALANTTSYGAGLLLYTIQA